jgi:hypothetical protein
MWIALRRAWAEKDRKSATNVRLAVHRRAVTPVTLRCADTAMPAVGRITIHGSGQVDVRQPASLVRRFADAAQALILHACCSNEKRWCAPHTP